VIILKARQLGMSWLVLAFILWLMLFYPVATVLIFSRRDNEAVDLLTERLRGMYDRLPPWLQSREITVDAAHEWAIFNGSRALAFPTTAGDSYTGTIAFVDEADLVPDLNKLLRSVKPTIDANGRLVLLSRVDKSKPNSLFKKLYRQAKQSDSEYFPIFLPWYARPDRTTEWYEEEKRATVEQTGSTDYIHEQYPETDAQALSARVLDKRINPEWIEACTDAKNPLPSRALPEDSPSIPQLFIYQLPLRGHAYVIGADPAEGKSGSNESAAVVLNKTTGEQVAELAGRIEMSVFASHLNEIAVFYNGAEINVERNNHGHTVLLWLRDNSRMPVCKGEDGNPGWDTKSKSKAFMYSKTADAFRLKKTAVHSETTAYQLGTIEASTLSAPEGLLDDRATAYGLALLRVDVKRKVINAGGGGAKPANQKLFSYKPR
jgi:hypothetical protein